MTVKSPVRLVLDELEGVELLDDCWLDVVCNFSTSSTLPKARVCLLVLPRFSIYLKHVRF